MSRYPVSHQKCDCIQTQGETVIAAVVALQTQAEGGEGWESDSLTIRQREDPYLNEIMVYLEAGELPTDEKRARELVLESSQFTLDDGVL